jgi:hypothetical protein
MHGTEQKTKTNTYTSSYDVGDEELGEKCRDCEEEKCKAQKTNMDTYMPIVMKKSARRAGIEPLCRTQTLDTIRGADGMNT